MRLFFGIHDYDKSIKGMRLISSKKELEEMSKKGFGIFMTVNSFSGNERKEIYIKRLECFYAEFDDIDKEDQLDLISKHLKPTMIVESKRGFQVYWAIKDDLIKMFGWKAALNLYKNIHKYNIGDRLGCDPLKDGARVLRVPGYYHQKDPCDPFMVKLVLETNAKYGLHEFVEAFPPVETGRAEEKKNNTFVSEGKLTGTIWDKVSNLNHKHCLLHLSGTGAVKGDTIQINKNQIWCNGKPTGAWLDNDGRIGSHSGGGPTIAHWLFWYHKDWAKVAKCLEEHFPELKEETLWVKL